MATIASDFPCKKCTHKAGRHYDSVGGYDSICLDCATAGQSVEPDEHWHVFEGDNLKFMELKKKKQELLNEQA